MVNPLLQALLNSGLGQRARQVAPAVAPLVPGLSDLASPPGQLVAQRTAPIGEALARGHYGPTPQRS